MKVYVVTSGEYSDYRINAIFTDREQAKIFCASRNASSGDYYRIEDWKTDVSQSKTNLKAKIRYEARVTAGGKSCDVYNQLWTFRDINSVEQWHDGAFHVILTLNSELPYTKLEKIIRDRIAKFKAERMM